MIDQVWNLTMSMLGSAAHPCLAGKAKECHGLLEFAHELLLEYDFSHLTGDDLTRHKMLVKAGRHALRFDSLVQTTPRHISSDIQSQMLNEFIMHCTYLERSGSDRIVVTPKRDRPMPLG